jgi:glycyl-tRNA synthetase
MADPEAKSMDEIVALCKRRGFIYPASEIYGGINGFWDYGPLGVQLKNNIRDLWWKAMVECPPLGPLELTGGDPLQIVGIDSAIIQHPKTWQASGHLATFADPMRKCRRCGHFVRADHLWELIETSSKWFESLLQEFTPDTGGIDSQRLMRWATGKGRRVAPNLAVVRSPEVTLSFLATRITGQPDAPPDMRELVRYLATEQLHAAGLQDPCPLCGGELGEAEPFKLMFESYAGLTQSEENKVYLRPETAQGIFLNYRNVLDTTRVKIPFGIAQVGKAFRNEVTPRNFVFRSREFEQMEMEWFCRPLEARQWKEFWQEQRMNWYRSLGLSAENLIFREHETEELSHYAKAGSGTADIEYRWPFTAPKFGELEGIAHRTDFDLKAHAEHSGTNMEYFDPQRNERFYPHVIEPAAGLTRTVLAVICEAFTPTPDRAGSKYILKFLPAVAPVKAGVFPLVNKNGMPEVARALYMKLRGRFTTEYDPKQSIGRRYARMDEVGTPYCFTIDGQTLSDQTVTVRDRDSASQQRIALDQVERFLSENLGV